MMKVNWTVNVSGGTWQRGNQASVEVSGLVQAQEVIPAGAPGAPGTKTIKVGVDSTDDVKVLLITSSVCDKTLTYTVDGGPAISLDSPAHLYLGSGLVKKSLGAGLGSFNFSNETNQDATVEILVGRMVAP